ncbi:hypothetical protein ACGIF2_10295 [Cellulomonas sp. P22]|uniref:hypothetical protein n=1 Tax=Cellulomonas sp. P22 TaxID=3373189 RepID=UPI0037AA5C1C
METIISTTHDTPRKASRLTVPPSLRVKVTVVVLGLAAGAVTAGVLIAQSPGGAAAPATSGTSQTAG